MKTKIGLARVALFLLLSVLCPQASAQGNAFTYQGFLTEGGAPVNGTIDFQVRLYDMASGGVSVSGTTTHDDVGVTNGLFAVTLDFGSLPWNGNERWLNIAVRPGASAGPFTNVLPRQRITAAPHAIYAGKAMMLEGALPSSQLTGTYTAPVTISNAANVFAGKGSSLTMLDASQLTMGTVPTSALSNAWKLSGNAGTSPSINFLGTTDNQPLEIRVNGLRGLRLEDNGDSGSDSGTTPDGAPNVIGGSPMNSVAAGVVGAVIGGGGATNHSGIAFPNSVLADFGVVGGGGSNSAADMWTTVSGGRQNLAAELYGAVGGGINNSSTGNSATIAGGEGNQASGGRATVAGGAQNRASGSQSTVGGGFNNVANSPNASVPGGNSNTADGEGATVAGGQQNRASGQNASVGGGFSNWASGDYSTVAGGEDNTAAAPYSFAAGRRANAGHTGSFVWADGSSSFLFLSTVQNGFFVRSVGGVKFVTGIDPSTGAETAGLRITAGSSAWSPLSDRNSKENVEPVDTRALLERLVSIPIQTWNWKAQADSIRHIGPMAQDFYSAFNVGEDDKHITTVDADGVALAAIQGLNQKLTEELNRRDAENAQLRRELQELKQWVASLRETALRNRLQTP